MAHPQAKRVELRRLYVFEKIALEKAALKLNVHFSTARRWKNDAAAKGDDWDKVRAAHTMAGGELEDVARQLLVDLVLQFKATMDALKLDLKIKTEQRVELLTSLSDSYNKAISANKKLMPETSQLAVALDVLNKLAEYIKTNKPDMLMTFLDILEPFGEMLEKELK